MNYSDFLTQAVIISILAAGVRLATPILLASLGELLSERSGVLNLGLEGVMMFGTLFGFVVSQQTGSPWLGALAGAAAGGIAGLIIGFLCITIYGNQAIVGVVFNILAVGLTGFIFRAIYGVRTTETPPRAQGFAPLEIPILKDIPILGDIFFKHPPLVYIAILMVPVMAFLLWRTRYGLNVRSVGGFAKAADTMGINVFKTRYLALILGELSRVLGAHS